MASSLITTILVIFHITAIAQFVVYVIQKTVTDTELQLDLIEVDLGLTEASYLLAALALPWAWFLGLLIPLKVAMQQKYQKRKKNLILKKKNVFLVDSFFFTNFTQFNFSVPLKDTSQQLDMNLKLAKQNKQRNVIRKLSKDSHGVSTPPTSPMKFSPSVTSSPSIHTLEAR